MIIAVNARFLIKNKLEGIGWYSYEVLKRIVIAHPEHQFLFLFDRPFDEEFIFARNIVPLVLPPPARHPVLWHIWFQIMVPWVLRRYKADVFFSPDGFVPLYAKVKTVAVIHDINFERYPEFVPFLTSWYYRRFFPKFAAKSSIIITVSEFSKNEIIKFYHIDEDKISVIYNGVNEKYIISGKQENLMNMKSYFLFVGALSPRKNIEFLLRAFDSFKASSNADVSLLIVGEKMHLNKQMNKIFLDMEYKNDVRFLGRLPLKDLVDVYKNALAMVFIPYYEGFGIPLVEAMASGIPVIASDIDVLREVAQDAAIFVPPAQVQTVAAAMTSIWLDTTLWADLSKKGLLRAAYFSWNKSAEKVWKEIAQFLH
jgi:glycosyltransferase involved in cell wall biosynthesis